MLVMVLYVILIKKKVKYIVFYCWKTSRIACLIHWLSRATSKLSSEIIVPRPTLIKTQFFLQDCSTFPYEVSMKFRGNFANLIINCMFLEFLVTHLQHNQRLIETHLEIHHKILYLHNYNILTHIPRNTSYLGMSFKGLFLYTQIFIPNEEFKILAIFWPMEP